MLRRHGLPRRRTSLESDALTETVIGAAISVHRAIGPGLLESAYEACLSHELTLRGINWERQVPIPLAYRGRTVGCSYRADLLVENKLLVEVKAIEGLGRIHTAQVLTYLRLLDIPLGLLLNFNALRLSDGIRRVVNNL